MSPLAITLVRLAVVMVPLVFLAWHWQVFPQRRMVWVALAPAVGSLALLAGEVLRWPILVVDALALAVLAADLGTLPRRSAFSAQRRAGRVASLRKRHPVQVTVLNHSGQSFLVEIRDGVPEPLQPEPSQFVVHLEARSRTTLDYVLRPARRGAFRMERVYLRAGSRLGFWTRLFECPAETAIHVYPDMQQLGHYALLARTNRLSLVGVRRQRRIGQDHEFERLRDYALDDNYKRIDWRATARRRKLTVRDYQSSQSQRVLFLIDCGRMMTNQAAGLTLLDHALNAALMLSFVALGQADSVGLICFSDRIHGYVPLRGGRHHMNRLLHGVFDRFPRLVESRYDLAFRYLGSHVRKRSLIILITNVIDEVNAHQVERYLTNLVGRHLPLAVLLRDRRLFDAVEAEHPRGEALWQAAAAAEILAWRHQVLADLSSKGALVLDVFPEEMTAPLVNRYLQIKARHLL